MSDLPAENCEPLLRNTIAAGDGGGGGRRALLRTPLGRAEQVPGRERALPQRSVREGARAAPGHHLLRR